MNPTLDSKGQEVQLGDVVLLRAKVVFANGFLMIRPLFPESGPDKIDLRVPSDAVEIVKECAEPVILNADPAAAENLKKPSLLGTPTQAPAEPVVPAKKAKAKKTVTNPVAKKAPAKVAPKKAPAPKSKAKRKR